MNEINGNPAQKLTQYQAQRFKELIEEIIHCCQERIVFQSRKFDLTPSEFRCLLLFKQERYLTVKNIAFKLEVAKSRVSKILDGLLTKQLIQFIDDPEDARVKLFSLAPSGRQRLEIIDNFINEIHQELVLALKPTDRGTVLSCLELLRSSMESVKEKLV